MRSSFLIIVLVSVLLCGSSFAYPSWHIEPDRSNPWTNCTSCHGPNLDDGFAPSCMSCHNDFFNPDLPPPGHHMAGRDDPLNNCTLCHGSTLTGGTGPSCYTCHDDLWIAENVAPVVDSGGPYSGVAGEAVLFDASGTVDADGDTLIYLWNFGDGSAAQFPSQNPTASHVYTSSGTYTVILTVTDSVNDPVMVETVATISPDNLPPVVDSGGPYSGFVGETIEFDCSGTTDPDGDTLTYLWDFGDGSPPQFPSQVPTTSHVYNNAGNYTAMLTVTDGINNPVLVSVSVSVEVPSGIIYVDGSALGRNNGSTWSDAYNYLADGLRDGRSGDSIWVGEGAYRPGENIQNGGKTEDRRATFSLIEGVSVYGGFPSGGGWEDRNAGEYVTVLSGDIGELDVISDNCYNVVDGSRTAGNSILDGFTITAGNANGEEAYRLGGGMFCGGGYPVLVNCRFVGNVALYGGGMYNGRESRAFLVNCSFVGNESIAEGGGMYNSVSRPELINCVFSGNVSHEASGGGMWNDNSNPTLINCSFSGNRAAKDGGGIFNYSDSIPTISNCIVWGNVANKGVDERAQIANYESQPVIDYSCVQGWTGNMGGEGNFGADPLFKDADGLDDIVGTLDDDLQLASGSPCIDAGANGYVPLDGLDLDEDGATLERVPIDLAGNARFTDDPATVDTGRNIKGYPLIVEMGAYERYEFCGSEAFPYPPGDSGGPGGLRDCRVNMFDLAVLAAYWMEDTGPE